jgi:hypothetical protein
MSARAELHEWLRRNEPTLYPGLASSRDPADDVATLNRLTGLNLKWRSGADPEDLCGQYLSELRKGGRMAMSIDEYKRQLMLQQMQQAKQGQYMEEAFNRLQQQHAPSASQPVPQPEPNKVLLLLGEDE